MKNYIAQNQQKLATEQERRKLFLRYVNRGWLVFGIVTLIALPFFSEQRSQFTYLAILTFPIYLIVRILNLSGRTRLAGVVFTISANFVFYGLFLVLVRDLGAEEAFRTQATVWMLMGLAVLFAGTFIDKWAAPVVAVFNTVLLIGTRLTLAPESEPRPSVMVFWLMIAITIWLYERTLQQAFAQAWNEVAERARAEETMRLQSVALEAAANGIVITDRDGIIQWANPAFSILTGYTVKEAVGKNPRDLIRSGRQDQAFYKDMWDTILAGQVWHGELVNRRKNGTLYTEEMTLTPLKDGDDQVIFFIAIKQDVTERVRAEQALRESEKRYRLLAENVTDVIWTMDMNLRSTYTSPSVKRLRGYDNDDAMTQSLEEALTPASFEIAARAFEEELAIEKMPEKDLFRSRTLEFEIFRKDGSTVWVETTTTFLRDSDGQPVGILGVTRDASGRKAADQALHDSQLQLAGIIDSAMDAIVTLGADQRIILFNPAAEQLFRCPAEEAIGQPLDRFIPEYARENHREFIRAFGQTNQTSRSMGSLRPLTCLRADGEEFPAEITISQTDMAEGKIYTAILRDITTRVLAEDALHESEEKYRLLFENVMNGFALHEIVLNNKGKPIDYIFLEVNDAFEQLTGLKRESIIGKKATNVIPGVEDDPADWIGKYGKVTLTGKEIRFEQQAQALDKWYAVLAFRPRAGQFATIFEDITDRKQAEGELRRRIDELSALHQTTLDIINVHDQTELLNTIVMRAVDLLGGTSGGLYLCDPVQARVHCVVSYKTLKDYTGTVLAYGEGAAGVVAATGEPLIIDDYRTWESRALAFEIDHPFSAVISVPMLWQGQVTGVIHVLHNAHKHKFTGEDLKLLTSFANQAAVVVENARLFEETQRRLDRLSVLQRIDQVITSSLDLHVTLNILLGQILQYLEVNAAAVLLYQPELQSLEFVAGQGFRTRALQSTNLHLGQGFAGQAAIQQHMVQVFDLEKLQTGFLRSPEFRSEEFVAYIGVPLIAKGNIIGVLEIYNRQQLDPDEEWMDFLETLAGQAAIAIDNINLFNDLEMSNLELIQAYDATIEGWAGALELRDMETEGHSRRVVDMTLELARKMGIEDTQLAHIRQGALLHDIGKMGVPDSILQKTGALTDDEWKIIHQHPLYAHKLLSPISYLRSALDIPYCHHEKWDGTGYPRGLKGEQIPLAARIFTLVDVWDALTSDRTYRKAWTEEKALKYIRQQSGGHFDPKVVDAFLKMIRSD